MFYSGYILICNNLTVWNKSILQPIVVKFCFFYRYNCLLHCYLLLLSLTIMPSAISITLLHFAAISLSWITMIIVLPDSFSFSKTDIISSVVLLSSAPVGSSASITDGSLTYSTGNSRTLFLSARQLVTVLVCLLFYSDQFKRSLCCFSFIFGLVFCKIKREHYPLLPVRWQRVFCLGRGIVGRIRWKRRCRLSGHRLITCKPHRALGSLLSVALSSMWVRHLHFSIIRWGDCQCSIWSTKVFIFSDATVQLQRLGVFNLGAIFMYSSSPWVHIEPITSILHNR